MHVGTARHTGAPGERAAESQDTAGQERPGLRTPRVRPIAEGPRLAGLACGNVK